MQTAEVLTAPAAPLARSTDVAAPDATATTIAFFDALNRAGIRYCHWKSNLRLGRGLSGATDLDLLIDPADAGRFREQLAAFRVRRVLAPPGKRYPSIEDYLGLDPATGALFHLHVHYRLVLGEQFVKNYRLPLEERFLDSARPRLGVMTPAPELELTVLCLRALLKYRDRDGLKDLLGIRSPGIPAHIGDEIRWLASQTTAARTSAVAGEALGPEVAGVIDRFLPLAVRASRDGRALLRLRRDARTALIPSRRHDQGAALARYARESIRRRNRLRFAPARKMTLPGGGLSVALLGADGAGKTTAAAALHERFGRMLETRRYYLGSKQPSWLSDRLYVAFRAFRRGHRSFAARFGATNVISRALAGTRQALLYAHYLSVGWDRYRRHRRGLRDAERGALVLYDRFPLVAPLDGPVIGQTGEGRLARAFARREEALYRRFQSPDLLLALVVDPDVSLRRKPDHDRDAVEAKARLLGELMNGAATRPVAGRVVAIDAAQPLPRVLAEAGVAIWDSLPPPDEAREAALSLAS